MMPDDLIAVPIRMGSCLIPCGFCSRPPTQISLVTHLVTHEVRALSDKPHSTWEDLHGRRVAVTFLDEMYTTTGPGLRFGHSEPLGGEA